MPRLLLAVALLASPAVGQNAHITHVAWDGDKLTTHMGSGTLIDVNPVSGMGVVLTAAHVLESTDWNRVITVELDDEKYKARTIAVDDGSDLAALLIPDAPDVCVSVNPFVSPTTSVRVVGFGRSGFLDCAGTILSKTKSEEVIADVAIGPGSSGGAMYDENGELCGMIKGGKWQRTTATSGRPLRRFLQRALKYHCNARIATDELAEIDVYVNGFNGSERSQVEMRLGGDRPWIAMESVDEVSPNYQQPIDFEQAVENDFIRQLPNPRPSSHLWNGSITAETPAVGYQHRGREGIFFGHRQATDTLERLAPQRSRPRAAARRSGQVLEPRSSTPIQPAPELHATTRVVTQIAQPGHPEAIGWSTGSSAKRPRRSDGSHSGYGLID